MKLYVVYILMPLLLCFALQICYAQDSGNFSVAEIPGKYFDKVAGQASSLSGKLDRKSGKALHQFEKQKEKLQRTLSKVDSLSAASIFGNVDKQYQQLTEKIKQPGQKLLKYIPSLDTMSTSLKFLEQYKGALKNTKQLQTAISKVDELKSQFQKAGEIQQFLKQERQYLEDNLQKYGGAYANQLKKLNKQAYYYSEQLKEYKETLKDENKIERKTIDLLSKTKVYQKFMRKNSMLASLFQMPSDNTNVAAQLQSIAGLQTRAQVNSQIQDQFGSGGTSAMQQLQGNVQQAQGQLTQLKGKLQQVSPLGGDLEGANSQKTKPFLKRLELGTNLQTKKSNGFFPVTSDIGISVGYKANDKSVIGIGASYKMGLGQNIRNMKITNQGVGLRSFIDVKWKRSLWMSGGFEMNYQTDFAKVEQLKEYSAWQWSGLIGLSRKFSVNTKFFKNTTLKLLWDFLSYGHVPRENLPIKFRVGYNF